MQSIINYQHAPRDSEVPYLAAVLYSLFNHDSIKEYACIRWLVKEFKDYFSRLVYRFHIYILRNCHGDWVRTDVCCANIAEQSCERSSDRCVITGHKSKHLSQSFFLLLQNKVCRMYKKKKEEPRHILGYRAFLKEKKEEGKLKGVCSSRKRCHWQVL